VFNLIQGTGSVAGAALASHPAVDMISFTGSTRGGIEVARAAAASVKRVAQELGGKSPNIIVDGDAAAFAAAVKAGVELMMTNSGQSCSAPSRMLVPSTRMREACNAAAEAAKALSVGDPTTDVRLGPIVSRAQFEKVQALIQSGIDEGAKLVTGGVGRPRGLERGYYVRPTIFGDVSNDMRIAREEIFGPVLAIIPFDTIEEAVRIANDTEYGLAAYVHASDLETAKRIARQLRAGQVLLNGASFDLTAPFGGYKRSGNGRECGDFAFHEFLEIKAMLGHTPSAAPA
jgi:aldehyde dehydrogenase (NAD+)